MRWLTTITLVVFGLAAVSCVMPQDLEALAAEQRLAQHSLEVAQDEFQETVQAILENQELTQEERTLALEQARGIRDKAVSDALDKFAESSEAIAKAVEDRSRNIVQPPVPITGNPLLDLVANLVIGVGGTIYGTNRVRDNARRKRGEPVGPNAG